MPALWGFFEEVAARSPGERRPLLLQPRVTVVRSGTQPNVDASTAGLGGTADWGLLLDRFTFCRQHRELHFPFAFVFQVLIVHVDIVFVVVPCDRSLSFRKGH